MDATIADIARGNGGVYTVDAHRAPLAAHFGQAEVTGILDAHGRRLAMLERAGAANRTSSGWTVRDADALGAGVHARARGGTAIVDVLSGRSVQSQVNAQAWTWLDRQMHRVAHGRSTEVGFDPTLQVAAETRRRWMIEHGYAATVDGQYRLRPAAAHELRQREWQAVSQEHQKRHGVAVTPLAAGPEVQGRYRGTLTLHGGPNAIVASRERTYLVPVPRTPATPHGTAVVARVLPGGRGMVVTAPQRAARQLERE